MSSKQIFYRSLLHHFSFAIICRILFSSGFWAVLIFLDTICCSCLAWFGHVFSEGEFCLSEISISRNRHNIPDLCQGRSSPIDSHAVCIWKWSIRKYLGLSFIRGHYHVMLLVALFCAVETAVRGFVSLGFHLGLYDTSSFLRSYSLTLNKSRAALSSVWSPFGS